MKDHTWNTPLALHRLIDPCLMDDTRKHINALSMACRAHDVSLQDFMAAWIKQTVESPLASVPGNVPVQDILATAKAEYRKPSGAGLENYGLILVDEDRRQALAKLFARYNPEPDRLEVIRAEMIFKRWEELNPGVLPAPGPIAFCHRDGTGPNDYRVVISDRIPPSVMADWHQRCGHALPAGVFDQEESFLQWLVLHEIAHGIGHKTEPEADAWANREGHENLSGGG